MKIAYNYFKLSFTTGGLFLRESMIVARCFVVLQDWQSTREQVRQENLLQARTAATGARISKEITARLEMLNTEEIESLLDFNIRDQAYLLWVAVCRRYSFIRQFATEILREYYLSSRCELSLCDYENFYNNKAICHLELDEITSSTQKKLRQNLFRMLREAGLVSEHNVIQPALLGSQLVQLLANGGEADLLVFPISDRDIQRWLV